MAIRILKRFFETTDQVLDDIKRTGFWPTTLIAPASPELPLHWHDCEVHTYVIAGSTWTLDGVTGERVAMEPGDKLVIPAGVLHAEGDTPAPVTYIVALPEPRPFGEFLTLLPLWPTTSKRSPKFHSSTWCLTKLRTSRTLPPSAQTVQLLNSRHSNTGK